MCKQQNACRCLMDQYGFILTFILSALILGAVYIWDVFSDVKPCILCIYERYPYWISLVLSFMGIFNKKYCFQKALLYILLITLMASFGLACYHVTVELQWVTLPKICTVDHPVIETMADMQQSFKMKPVHSACDQVPITIFGLSLAQYNAIVSLMWLGAIIYWIRKRHDCIETCCTNSAGQPCR